MPETASTCLGALALELRPGAHAGRGALERAEAAALAEGIALDLAALVPEAAALEIAVLAAHYDPVELLRPGWPLHAAIDELARRAPMGAARDAHAGDAAGGRILAFGSREGHWPDAVPAPAPDFARGVMRLVPFVLRSDDAATAGRVRDAFEELLIDRGMAGAATALLAQRAFEAPIEHARYFTIHDLAAMMAMQYEHAGLGALWTLVETALLAPRSEAWLDAPPEPLARYDDGGVRMTLLDSEAWRNGGFAPASAGEDADRLELAYEHFEARQRQFDAILEAHGIPVTFDHCPAGKDPREILRA